MSLKSAAPFGFFRFKSVWRIGEFHSNLLSFFQPLLHTILFLIEMAVTMRLAAKFNSYYAEKPGKESMPRRYLDE